MLVGDARERFGHDAVCAQLDLPDFFENLAGNHAGDSLKYIMNQAAA